MVGSFVVIGLGVFGRTVAVNLTRMGHQVLAIDQDEEEAQRVAGELDAVVSLDATDESALKELGLERAYCAVVAIGVEAMEASILVTALLRQMGVPRIVARALSDLHARVLLAVGAHEVVSPEAEMGLRLARRLAEPNVLERLELGEGAQLAEVEAPAAFLGRTLVELDVRRRFGVSVVALRRGGKVRATIDGSERVAEGDVMVVIGTAEAIGRIAGVA
jgi:trk system potassium uptake protein TrkA